MLDRSFLAQIGRFGIVGVTSVLLDALVYFLCIYYGWLEPDNAKRLSFVAGATFGFFCNRDFTFKVKEKNLGQPFRFVFVYAISFASNSGVHDLTLDAINVPALAFFTATTTSTIMNYLGQRYYVFK